jgi:hypothetical protein
MSFWGKKGKGEKNKKTAWQVTSIQSFSPFFPKAPNTILA